MEKEKNKIDSISSHQLNKYPPRSAIKKIIIEVPVANRNETVGAVLNNIKKNIRKFKTINYIYVINSKKNLIGVVSLKALFRHSKKTEIGRIMETKLISVSPGTDQEKIADLAVKHNIKAIPVVENKKLIGIIHNDQILSTLNKALREDALHFAGIHKANLKYENTLETPLFLSILHRLPWLLIGLFGIIVAAIFISIFEETLQKYLILASFIPVIIYLSGALGIQHQTLFIRDITFLGKELKLTIYFLRQMFIGFLLSIVIGSIVFLIITFFWEEPFMAFVISTSIFFALIFTSFTALLTTLIIKKLKSDPAIGSGPISTIISDVTSIIIYFAVASILLGGL